MKKRSSRHIERYILELNDISQPFYIKSTYYIDSHVDTFNSINGLPTFILFKFQRCFISFFLETTARMQPVNVTNCSFFQSVEIEIVPRNGKNSNEIVISMMTQNKKNLFTLSRLCLFDVQKNLFLTISKFHSSLILINSFIVASPTVSPIAPPMVCHTNTKSAISIPIQIDFYRS